MLFFAFLVVTLLHMFFLFSGFEPKKTSLCVNRKGLEKMPSVQHGNFQVSAGKKGLSVGVSFFMGI